MVWKLIIGTSEHCSSQSICIARISYVCGAHTTEYIARLIEHMANPVVFKEVDIDPQGSIRLSKGVDK